jgi:hypothetical protein
MFISHHSADIFPFKTLLEGISLGSRRLGSFALYDEVISRLVSAPKMKVGRALASSKSPCP